MSHPPEHGAWPTPSPNDHVRTLIELLRPAGTDLARRWLAALLIVPEEDRADVVDAVERRIVEEYARTPARADETLLDVAEPPTQRDGYVEQIIRTYARAAHRTRDDADAGPAAGRSAS